MTSQTKVLYIEDDKGSQRLVQRVLESHDYAVFIADRGLDGLDIARQKSPDLILMDINLPEMNGREITTRLRSLPNFSNVPIVALTANISPGHREQALAAGCDGFLTKPINVVSFPEEVKSFLEGYRDRLEEEERVQHLERHAQELVTRLEHKIKELEEANERLREIDRVKSNFIALVSHELRTPLTLLEGYTHLLDEFIEENEEDEYPPSLRNLVEGMNRGVGRISQVINEIINVSRIASGTLELSLGPVQISRLVNTVVGLVNDTCQKRDLTLHVDDSLDDLPIIQGDGTQLRIAIENVVGNAVKYTPDGGDIHIRSRAVGDAIDLIIEDTGIGIPAGERRRIFDQFHILETIEHHSTSKSAFQGGGLGLGLAIARGIIEAHDGRIWVESAGRDEEQLPGSTFHLLLPLKQAQAQEM